MKRRTFQVPLAGDPGLLARAIAQDLGLGESTARALVERGAVYVDGRRCPLPHAALRPGQTVLVILEESGRSVLDLRSLPPLVVLFEDAHVLAVNKPPGVNAQPSPGGTGDSLLDMATQHLNAPAGLVHRLDRETSGVTVFGKTSAATSALAEAFRTGAAQKRYLAVTTAGLPLQGTVELPLSRDPKRPGRFRAVRGHGIPAATDYERIGDSPEFCIVALTPRTGRTHQLRAHLAALGAPILGDTRYGGARSAAGLPAPRCLLHAQRLALPHPQSGDELELVAPVPPDIQAFLDSLQSPRPE